MYYRRGYRKRRYRYSASARAAPRRARGSRLYGGIDADVRRLFFELDSFRLGLVFNLYEREHGEGKREYAEAAYAKWRSGTVEMSGETSERLIRIVPQVLRFDQKYDLIEKLWNRLRQKTTLHVTISPHGGLDGAIDAVMDAVDALGEHEIPDAVAERLEWLAQYDAVVAKKLLAQVAKREAKDAVETLEAQLRQLLAVACQHQDKVVIANRTVALPGVIVYINVSQTTATVPRRPAMTDGEHETNNSKPAPLAGRDDQPARRDLAPIQKPDDLVGEVLRALPGIAPQKQEQIVVKVAEEVARIQMKRAEGHVDHEMAKGQVENVANAASRLGNEGVEFEVKADHRSEHGSMHVTVRNKPPAAAPAGLAKGLDKCFIATACYGDYSHPAVVVLRRFRDECLRKNARGRLFIAWYCRSGPTLAEFIERRPGFRVTGRLLLWPVVLAASGVLWLAERIFQGREDQIPR